MIDSDFYTLARKNQFKLTAPSYWASYLINGDASGLNAVEKLACDDWSKSQGVLDVLDCEDAGFCRHHDADEFALAGDCQTYLCLCNHN